MFSPQSRLRHAVADTFAMVVYCSVVNMLIEIFLSGMSFEQSLSSRPGVCGYFADGGRRLASNRRCGKFKYRGIHADGCGVRLLS